MAADRRVASSGSTSDCKCPPEAVPPTSRHLKKRRVVKYRARKRPEKSRKKGNSSSSCYRLFFFFLLYIFYLALLCVSTYFVIRKEKNKQNKRNVCWVYNSSCARPPLSMYFPSHVTRAAAQQRKYIRFSTTRQILSLHGNTTFRVHVASSWVYIYIHLFFLF